MQILLVSHARLVFSMLHWQQCFLCACRNSIQHSSITELIQELLPYDYLQGNAENEGSSLLPCTAHASQIAKQQQVSSVNIWERLYTLFRDQSQVPGEWDIWEDTSSGEDVDATMHHEVHNTVIAPSQLKPDLHLMWTLHFCIQFSVLLLPLRGSSQRGAACDVSWLL